MYTYLFPEFLKLDLIVWSLMIVVFLIFARHIFKLPGDTILKYKAKAIENKERLGIKIYKI